MPNMRPVAQLVATARSFAALADDAKEKKRMAGKPAAKARAAAKAW